MSETISTKGIQSSLPSPLRWLILGLLFAISVVTYIDRVNISVTARQMMPALGLTDQEMGLVFSAFVVGYARSKSQAAGSVIVGAYASC